MQHTISAAKPNTGIAKAHSQAQVLGHRPLTNGCPPNGQLLAHRASQQTITSAFSQKSFVPRQQSEVKNDKNHAPITKNALTPGKCHARVRHSGPRYKFRSFRSHRSDDLFLDINQSLIIKFGLYYCFNWKIGKVQFNTDFNFYIELRNSLISTISVFIILRL